MKKFESTSAIRPSIDMNRLNWLLDRWIWAISYSAVILIPLPLLLVKAFAIDWLPLPMAIGPLLAGIWLFANHQLAARQMIVTSKSEGVAVSNRLRRQAADYRRAAITWMVRALILALVAGGGSTLVILLGNDSWSSYNLLKSGGFVSYALLGLLPVIAYAVAIQRLLAKRSLNRTIACMIISLLAAWFWRGFAVYAAYHSL